MLDGNNDRTVDESYLSAACASSLKLEPHRHASADLIAAAGMNMHRTGLALLRLVSEWQSGATPQPTTTRLPKELRKEVAVARVDSGIVASEEEYGGMRLADKNDRRAAAQPSAHEIQLAEAEARRLAAESADWHLHETKLRLQRLKTLPTVRAALVHWVRERDWEDADAEALVAGVLRYFLAPKCSSCGGSGVREFAGNNRHGAGKACRACRERMKEGKIRVMGEMPLPGHGRGRALLKHMLSCIARARGDLTEGAHRLLRSTKSEEARSQRRHHDKVQQLQRADAEAQVDAKADTAAIASKFKDSMGAVRRR